MSYHLNIWYYAMEVKLWDLVLPVAVKLRTRRLKPLFQCRYLNFGLPSPKARFWAKRFKILDGLE